MSDPHWLVTAAIGAALGAALPGLIQLVLFVWRRRKADRLEGDWFEYHVTFIGGKAVIVSGTWKIRKGFQGLRVDYKHEDDAKLKYQGLLTRERGHLLAVLHGASDAETLYYRFVDPVGSKNVVPGLWLSYDREGSICSGSAILALEACDEATVAALLSSAVYSEVTIPALRIARSAADQAGGNTLNDTIMDQSAGSAGEG